MYTFYSECIAMSQDVASFNVEILNSEKVKIGKANALLSKNLNGGYNTSIIIQGSFEYSEKEDLYNKIFNHCTERYRAVFVKK